VERNGEFYYEFGALGHRTVGIPENALPFVYDVDVEYTLDGFNFVHSKLPPIGIVFAESNHGVVGILTKDAGRFMPGLDLKNGERTEIGYPVVGPAQMLLEKEPGKPPAYHDISITRVEENFAGHSRSHEYVSDLVYNPAESWITVGGMSGAPIVQNGNLVGIHAAAAGRVASGVLLAKGA
jgi:hypothetical protein